MEHFPLFDDEMFQEFLNGTKGFQVSALFLFFFSKNQHSALVQENKM